MSSFRIRLPQIKLLSNLSIRTKITTGFALVLILSAASVAVAYLGYDKVASGFSAYRTSVSEGMMARTIDREVTAYQLAARYYIVTGDESDATNAMAAEGDLRDAIDKASRDMKDPGTAQCDCGAVAEVREIHQGVRPGARSQAGQLPPRRERACSAAAACCARGSRISPTPPRLPTCRACRTARRKPARSSSPRPRTSTCS